MINFHINKLNIAKALYLLFITSFFLQIHYIFPTFQSYQTGAYSDFTSISLYLSDIFLILASLFTFLPRGRKESLDYSIKTQAIPLFLWLIIGMISHYSSLTSLNWWFFIKFIELFVAYETSKRLFRETNIKALFIRIFVGISSLESVLALVQFTRQTSLGGLVHKIGESVLNPRILGLAKIVSGETAYIRGYGTFPHPNVLSAFLLVAVLFSIYLLLTTIDYRLKTIYGLAMLLNILGLAVTFSRAAFFGLGFGLILFFGYLLWNNWSKPTLTKIWFVLGITLASIIITIALFKPFLSTRATVSDSASLERIFYAKIGLKMIKDNPIFGIGIGDSVLHMQQYSPVKLWPWQIQPIHNYFLLAAAELGIPGALILLWIFLSKLKAISKRLKAQNTFESTFYCLLLTVILASFLVLMQFDHYFYTLQQTQMLLWVILGIISANVKINKS